MELANRAQRSLPNRRNGLKSAARNLKGHPPCEMGLHMLGTSVAWNRLAKILLLNLGLEIRRLPRVPAEHLPVERIEPSADYAPWHRDAEFLWLYDVVQQYTLVDLYRCWELWTLVAEVREVPGIILEVGVWRGGTGAVLAYQERRLGLNTPVYLCDTFRGVVKSSAKDLFYRGGEHADCSAETVRQLVQRLGLRNVHILEGIFPEETAAVLPTTPIRLCHIDVDTHDSAAGCFEWVWPRLARGGIVVFDDYGFSVCQGVTDYVNSLRGQPGRVVIHNLNGHALVIKTGDA